MEPEIDDVEAWAALAEADSEEFERRRLAAIEKVISSAPPARQARLRGLQFRVDMERKRCATPLAACIRINSMMWESVVELRGALNSLVHGAPLKQKPQREAKVLAFPAARTKR